ncbi:DUF3085 domain-containing protein [Paraburkholderia sp. BL9I2N2]|uniref:DUF3085 domain-containing protein n=1 Tax=Paraburkholderia sp. BL9I2N2 TaxID=1938809 RepID=UPI001051175C|nr:DUF3085 domain-containing protein [Paraburkholderia sp. BL9I2N2]TCK94685.1 DUF3085 family protein [Paraburkholderia sp. BL9I2N2]
MIVFPASELRPVLVEARTLACRVILVKDHGVYMMSEKSSPSRVTSRNGESRLIAYAVGCNPETVSFDEWWSLACTEFGGDDFAEYFDHDAAIFDRVIDDGWNLEIRADEHHLYLDVVLRDA